MGRGFLFWSEENVLELDGDDRCITLDITKNH